MQTNLKARPTEDDSTAVADPATDEACGAATASRALALRGDAGMATAEYAMATLAAVAFAGLLLAVLKSNAVKQLLTAVIERALTL